MQAEPPLEQNSIFPFSWGQSFFSCVVGSVPFFGGKGISQQLCGTVDYAPF